MIATRRGGPISASNFLAREFRPARKAAELPRVNFHSLRHTAATILASSSTPPGTVHRLLGHASFITTMKLYGGLTAEALEKAAQALGDAFKLKPAKAEITLTFSTERGQTMPCKRKATFG